jgi:hypothetical protein
MRFLLTSPLTLAFLLLPATACLAQPVNGNFEAGGTGWSTTQTNPAWTIEFPATGGNPGGYARIMSSFGGSMGKGCVRQTFDCPDDGNDDCLICLDYRHSTIDSEPIVGFVVLKIGGVEYYRTLEESFTDWSSLGIIVQPGTHQLSMCLDVLMGGSNNNGWEACFDNVIVNGTCDGVVPTLESSWGMIKALYE